jgi:hypothetical protein
MKDEDPAPYYTAFIDEAGDPGLNTVRPIDAVGGSEWLRFSNGYGAGKNEGDQELLAQIRRHVPDRDVQNIYTKEANVLAAAITGIAAAVVIVGMLLVVYRY